MCGVAKSSQTGGFSSQLVSTGRLNGKKTCIDLRTNLSSTKLDASPLKLADGQTKRKLNTRWKLAFTCESVWQGLKRIDTLWVRYQRLCPYFQIVKGRVKPVTCNPEGPSLEPTPNCDCHITRSVPSSPVTHCNLMKATQVTARPARAVDKKLVSLCFPLLTLFLCSRIKLTVDCFHVTSLPPSWRTITKDSS